MHRLIDIIDYPLEDDERKAIRELPHSTKIAILKLASCAAKDNLIDADFISILLS
jgi:hypothetical protein